MKDKYVLTAESVTEGGGRLDRSRCLRLGFVPVTRGQLSARHHGIELLLDRKSVV